MDEIAAQEALNAAATPTAINWTKILPHFDTSGFILAMGNSNVLSIDDPDGPNILLKVDVPFAFYLDPEVARRLAEEILRKLKEDPAFDAARPATPSTEG